MFECLPNRQVIDGDSVKMQNVVLSLKKVRALF